MAEIITVGDLPASIQTNEMVDTLVAGANARASRVAPCLISSDPAPTADQIAEAALVLIGAVKRWADAGAGSLQSQTAGPFGVTIDTRQRTGYALWPSEITDLQAICKAEGEGGRQTFSIDTTPRRAGSHIPWCSIFLGETCSCGSSINGHEGPLWEFGYGPDYA